MAKLFNNIRRKIIAENQSISRSRNYFKYAIGEIVLVVVGILIALNINNWNESRNHHKQEVKILNNLLVDLKKAEATSINNINNEEYRIGNFVKALNKKGQKSLLGNVKKDSIFKEIFWNLNTTTPVINTYSDLKNSGNLGLISNDSIRQSFTSLEKNIRSLNNTLKDRMVVQQINIDKIVFNKLNYLMLDKSRLSKYKIDYGKEIDYAALLKQQNILNIIAIKLDFTVASKDSRILLLKDIQSLISSIKKELKNNYGQTL